MTTYVFAFILVGLVFLAAVQARWATTMFNSAVDGFKSKDILQGIVESIGTLMASAIAIFAAYIVLRFLGALLFGFPLAF